MRLMTDPAARAKRNKLTGARLSGVKRKEKCCSNTFVRLLTRVDWANCGWSNQANGILDTEDPSELELPSRHIE